MRKILVLILVLFSFSIDICFALQVGNESAQLNIAANDAGVCFLVIDPQGRRAGYEPSTKQYVEEFPASFGCSFAKRGSESGRDETNDMFNSGGMMNLIPGIYTIEIIGVDLTTFNLSLSIHRKVAGEGPTDIDFKTLKLTPEQIAAIKANVTDFNFEGVIDKGLTSRFQFTYNSDPAKPAGTATKVVTLSSLKQDIILARKVKGIWEIDGKYPKLDYWINNNGIMNSLLKKADAIEASIAKGNKTSAKNQLNAFINEVNAQKGKHISDKAVKILLEDAQYMMESL